MLLGEGRAKPWKSCVLGSQHWPHIQDSRAMFWSGYHIVLCSAHRSDQFVWVFTPWSEEKPGCSLLSEGSWQSFLWIHLWQLHSILPALLQTQGTSELYGLLHGRPTTSILQPPPQCSAQGFLHLLLQLPNLRLCVCSLLIVYWNILSLYGPIPILFVLGSLYLSTEKNVQAKSWELCSIWWTELRT